MYKPFAWHVSCTAPGTPEKIDLPLLEGLSLCTLPWRFAPNLPDPPHSRHRIHHPQRTPTFFKAFPALEQFSLNYSTCLIVVTTLSLSQAPQSFCPNFTLWRSPTPIAARKNVRKGRADSQVSSASSRALAFDGSLRLNTSYGFVALRIDVCSLLLLSDTVWGKTQVIVVEFVEQDDRGTPFSIVLSSVAVPGPMLQSEWHTYVPGLPRLDAPDRVGQAKHGIRCDRVWEFIHARTLVYPVRKVRTKWDDNALTSDLKFGHGSAVERATSTLVLPTIQDDDSESVRESRDHVELGPRAQKIFQDLWDEREALAKAVASLNMVRRKGKANISLLDIEEDEELT
ncbi:hypothetical protein B0H11DRAFT_2187716 [Mycena galericulata]|nr:hypothetical protein B0H11DRAFT_2187716 [Mycena galericulata]